MSEARSTQTALAAKALMERIDNTTYRRIIETRAILGGWAGARGAGLWDPKISDAVALGAVNAVWDLLKSWADEVPSDAAALAEAGGSR